MSHDYPLPPTNSLNESYFLSKDPWHMLFGYSECLAWENLASPTKNGLSVHHQAFLLFLKPIKYHLVLKLNKNYN